MPTCLHYNGGMKPRAVQYTLRGVPLAVDRAVRKKAKNLGLSLNVYLLNLIQEQVAGSVQPKVHTDLDPLIGKWVDDPAVDRALSELRSVDEKDWK